MAQPTDFIDLIVEKISIDNRKKKNAENRGVRKK